MHLLPWYLERMPRPLLWASVAHAVLALCCLAALLFPAAPVLGAHPALKPLKFALSIALFLGALGVLLPALTARPWLRDALAWLFALTMVAEMAPILMQALRGAPSHFNTATPLDAVAWRVMLIAILIATAGMVCMTALATFRPLAGPEGGAMAPLLAFGWRAGLWLLLLSPISGFAMGGRLQHSVGGSDGGPGLPLFDWSVTHGDLRVAHFFALHALQLLPVLAWLLLRWAQAPAVRWGALLAVALGVTALCLGTLLQAFAGRPFLARAQASALGSASGSASGSQPVAAPRPLPPGGSERGEPGVATDRPADQPARDRRAR